MVVRLVVALDAVHHGDGIRNAGLLHPHRLEPALQGLVLFDILAVLRKGGGADDLDLPAGKGGLEDIARVHGALALAGGGDGVDLINEQNHVARLADLVQQALDPLLKLAAELGARHQGGQVQQIDFLVLQLGRHLPGGDPLGDALGNGGLAHAGLADQAGVVLLTPGQDLDGAVDLPVPAHDVVQLAGAGLGHQVLTVGVQVFAAGRLFAPLAVFGALAALAALLAVDAQREGGVAARGKAVGILPAVIAAVLLHPHHHGQGVGAVPHLLHHGIHPVFHIVHILFGHTELLHQVLHGLDVHFTGAVQAVALLLHLAILHPLDEDDGRSFFASNANHRRFLLSQSLAQSTLYFMRYTNGLMRLKI